MKALVIGTYDLSTYSRGKVLINGLKANNVDVELCLKSDKLKYFRIIKRLIHAGYDVVIANGRIALLLSKVFSRRPVVFDFFISAYDTQVTDRGIVNENSLKAKILWLSDMYACKLADLSLMINEAYLQFAVNEFKVPREKFVVLAKGADDGIFYPRDRISMKKDSGFTVEFHGSFIPLHGVETIIDAAEILKDERDITFLLIGKGQMFDSISKKVKGGELRNVSLIGWVKYENLPEYIGKADVCLGIFGTTDKAKRCITHKVYECIAMGRPVITEENDAVKSTFTDGENIVLCEAGNPKQLAEKILLLKKDKALRDKISKNAHKLYLEKFTPKRIGKELKGILAGILG